MAQLQDLLVPYKSLDIPTFSHNNTVNPNIFISLDGMDIKANSTPKSAKESSKIIPKQKFSWFQSEQYIPTVESANPSSVRKQQLIPRQQLNTDGWDLQASLDRLNSRAGTKSKHLCAGYVWDALAAGGITGINGHARDVAQSGKLEANGFKPITRFKDSEIDDTYTPQAGDIVVSAPDNNKNTSGHHIAMYNGAQWVSDFKQNKMDVYGNKDNEWIIYRRAL